MKHFSGKRKKEYNRFQYLLFHYSYLHFQDEYSLIVLLFLKNERCGNLSFLKRETLKELL